MCSIVTVKGLFGHPVDFLAFTMDIFDLQICSHKYLIKTHILNKAIFCIAVQLLKGITDKPSPVRSRLYVDCVASCVAAIVKWNTALSTDKVKATAL